MSERSNSNLGSLYDWHEKNELNKREEAIGWLTENLNTLKDIVNSQSTPTVVNAEMDIANLRSALTEVSEYYKNHKIEPRRYDMRKDEKTGQMKMVDLKNSEPIWGEPEYDEKTNSIMLYKYKDGQPVAKINLDGMMLSPNSVIDEDTVFLIKDRLTSSCILVICNDESEVTKLTNFLNSLKDAFRTKCESFALNEIGADDIKQENAIITIENSFYPSRDNINSTLLSLTKYKLFRFNEYVVHGKVSELMAMNTPASKLYDENAMKISYTLTFTEFMVHALNTAAYFSAVLYNIGLFNRIFRSRCIHMMKEFIHAATFLDYTVNGPKDNMEATPHDSESTEE